MGFDRFVEKYTKLTKPEILAAFAKAQSGYFPNPPSSPIWELRPTTGTDGARLLPLPIEHNNLRFLLRPEVVNVN